MVVLVAADAYLITHPPASRQFGPRYAAETGCCVQHVAVSMIDVHPPDNGAENVARFIATRPDPGSYHVIVDSDTALQLVPDQMRAFHVAASGVNQFAWGISYACSDVDWRRHPRWDSAALTLGAASTAAYLVSWATRYLGDPTRARDGVRWISAAQAYAGEPGQIHHGQFQADRTDAWENHPDRAALDAEFLVLLAASVELALGGPSPPQIPTPTTGSRWFATQEA